jgi:hypothetical protein
MTLSEYDVRKAKAMQLKTMGINPYASSFDKKQTIQDILSHDKETFPDIEAIIPQPKKTFSTA